MIVPSSALGLAMALELEMVSLEIMAATSCLKIARSFLPEASRAGEIVEIADAMSDFRASIVLYEREAIRDAIELLWFGDDNFARFAGLASPAGVVRGQSRIDGVIS